MIANIIDVGSATTVAKPEAGLLSAPSSTGDGSVQMASFADAMRHSGHAIGTISRAEGKSPAPVGGRQPTLLAAAKDNAEHSSALSEKAQKISSEKSEGPVDAATREGEAAPDTVTTQDAKGETKAAQQFATAPKVELAAAEHAFLCQPLMSETQTHSGVVRKPAGGVREHDTSLGKRKDSVAEGQEKVVTKDQSSASVSATALLAQHASVVKEASPRLEKPIATGNASSKTGNRSIDGVAKLQTAVAPVQVAANAEKQVEASGSKAADAPSKLVQDPVVKLPESMQVVISTGVSGSAFVVPHEVSIAPVAPVVHSPAVSGSSVISLSPHNATHEPVVTAIESGKPNQIEVGVRGGEFGWVKVRAELAPSGDVNTFLRGSSVGTTQALQSQASSIQSFLGVHDVAVKSVQVEAPAISHHSPQPMSGDGDPQHRQEGAPKSSRSTREKESDVADEVSLQVVLPGQPVVSIAGTGNWLSVRA